MKFKATKRNTHQSLAKENPPHEAETIFATIEATYPASIRIKNNKLFPFVDFVFIDLAMLNGQEQPNNTYIVTSNILAASMRISLRLQPFHQYGRSYPSLMPTGIYHELSYELDKPL